MKTWSTIFLFDGPMSPWIQLIECIMDWLVGSIKWPDAQGNIGEN
jgi:hypothetical protein